MSEVRESVREAITHQVREIDVAAEAAVCTGFVIVAEFALPNGDLMLHRITGDAADESLSSWRRQGLLFNALHDEEAWESAESLEDDE